MIVDFSPIVNGVIMPLVATVLSGFAAYALARVAKYAHFQVSAGQRDVLNTAIENGVAYAEKILAGKENIQVAEKAAIALNYVLPKVPGALKSLGVTPEHLSQIITAKLPPPQ